MPNLLNELRNRKSPHGEVLAVSMMKDEAPFLLEWFAHHLAVGFTRILVYTNDCSDGTVEMLQRLEELGLGYHRENRIPEGVKPQPSALKHAQAEKIVQKSDWVLVFDADEFLVVSHPSGNLDGMISDAVERGANGIVITWRIFGSGGIVDWSREPVTEQYLRAAPPLWNKGWGVKTLFKFDPEYWKLGIHRPSIKNKHLETDFPDKVHWLNGSGEPMEDYFKFRGWRSIRRTLGYDWAQMNHYAVKSIDSYAVRKFRGNVNNKKDKYNADYWSLQDRNEIEDRAALKHVERRNEIMEAMLEDPVLAELHEAANQRVEARLEEYKKTEAYAELRDSLIEAGKVPITKVEAKPPQARDPAKIAALMSRVEKKAAEKPVSERRNENVDGWANSDGSPYVEGDIDLSSPISVDWVVNHEVVLPADPRVFSPEALNGVLSGRFDRRNARNIEGYFEGCNRLLEIGTGVGFMATRLNRLREDIIVVAQDKRPELIKIARSIASHNNLGSKGRLMFMDVEMVTEANGVRKAIGFNTWLRQFQPDALRIVDTATITPAILVVSDLSSVRRIVIPFENSRELETHRSTYSTAMKMKGFSETADRHESGSLQFDRSHKVILRGVRQVSAEVK